MRDIQGKVICIIGGESSMLINFRSDLISSLRSSGAVIYCFASDFDDSSRRRVSDLGAKAVDYSLNSKGLNPISDLFATLELIRKLKQIKPDVVFSFFVKPVIFSAIASKIAGVGKSVGMIEGLGNAFVKSERRSPKKTLFIKWVQKLLYRISLPLHDVVIFLNKDDPVDLLSGWGDKSVKWTVLGGIGVDLDKFPFKSEVECSSYLSQDVQFLFIGRLLREKGVFEFLDAARIVKGKYPSSKFVMLGGFDEKNPFALKRSELNDLLAQGVVIYPGFVDNVSEWIRESSVFVLPSYREGFPRSTQEAMTIGLPVITTDVPGCRDTVIDGVNGFVVPPFDSVGLAEKMIYFIENPNEIRSMGVESRRIAEASFDVGVVNERLCQLMFS